MRPESGPYYGRLTSIALFTALARGGGLSPVVVAGSEQLRNASRNHNFVYNYGKVVKFGSKPEIPSKVMSTCTCSTSLVIVFYIANISTSQINGSVRTVDFNTKIIVPPLCVHVVHVGIRASNVAQ